MSSRKSKMASLLLSSLMALALALALVRALLDGGGLAAGGLDLDGL